MKTFIIKENDIETYYKQVIKNSSCIEESYIKASLMGLNYHEVNTSEDLENVKKELKIGDCILLEYDGKLLPFQAVHRRKNGNVVLSSYYVSDNHIFDEHTNVWKNSSIRKYMNEDMARKFDPELLKYVKTVDVCTANEKTKDKFYLMSHEEIGYKDDKDMFKKNNGAEVFDYYKNAGDTEKAS